MTPYLLDVNLPLALTDPIHVHHEIAHRWFAKKGYKAWATYPLMENGFVGIASHPKYPNRPGDVPVVLMFLRRFCDTAGHHFWAECNLFPLRIPAPDRATIAARGLLFNLYQSDGRLHHMDP